MTRDDAKTLLRCYSIDPNHVDIDLLSGMLVEVAKQAYEKCAIICEETDQEYEEYTGREIPLNHTCAKRIRVICY